MAKWFVKTEVLTAPARGWGRGMGSQFSRLSSIWVWQQILELPSATNSFILPNKIIPPRPTHPLTLCQSPALLRGSSWQIPSGWWFSTRGAASLSQGLATDAPSSGCSCPGAQPGSRSPLTLSRAPLCRIILLCFLK